MELCGGRGVEGSRKGERQMRSYEECEKNINRQMIGNRRTAKKIHKKKSGERGREGKGREGKMDRKRCERRKE